MTKTPIAADSTATDGSPAARPGRVLVFNRDPELRIFVDKALSIRDVPFSSAETRAEIYAAMEAGDVALLLVAIDSPESMAFLSEAVTSYPSVVVVAIAVLSRPAASNDARTSGAA